jgi:hypothetical protein
MGQQDTGNHKQPGAADAGGADRFGGTRAGAENVEPAETGTTRSPARSWKCRTVQRPYRTR